LDQEKGQVKEESARKAAKAEDLRQERIARRAAQQDAERVVQERKDSSRRLDSHS